MDGDRCKSQLREEKLHVLTGRTVLLFPDADGYAEWKQRAGSMNFCKAIVSDIIEKNATPSKRLAISTLPIGLFARYGRAN